MRPISKKRLWPWLAKLTTLGAALAFGGCSASREEQPDPSTLEVTASAETSAQLGVARWRMNSPRSGTMVVSGLDADSNVLLQLGIDVARDEATATRTLVIRTIVDGRTATARAVIDDKKNTTIVRNELAADVRATQAFGRLRADFDDLKRGRSLFGTGKLLSTIPRTSLRPLNEGGELVAEPGMELYCGWIPISGVGEVLLSCGGALIGCGTTLAAPELGLLDVGFCVNDAYGCAEAIPDVNLAPPHYECSKSECNPCSKYDDSLYPGSNDRRNPNSTQMQCYRSRIGRMEQDCRLDGKCRAVTDEQSKEWQTQCGCNEPCNGGPATYGGGGPKG